MNNMTCLYLLSYLTALRRSLSAIAHRSYAGVRDVEQAIEEGQKQGIAHAMPYPIITQE